MPPGYDVSARRFLQRWRSHCLPPAERQCTKSDCRCREMARDMADLLGEVAAEAKGSGEALAAQARDDLAAAQRWREALAWRNRRVIELAEQIASVARGHQDPPTAGGCVVAPGEGQAGPAAELKREIVRNTAANLTDHRGNPNAGFVR